MIPCQPGKSRKITNQTMQQKQKTEVVLPFRGDCTVHNVWRERGSCFSWAHEDTSHPSKVFWDWAMGNEKVDVAQSCPILCDPLDYTLHGILQARLPEWVAFSFSSGSSQPRDRTQVSHIADGFFTSWATRGAQEWVAYPFSSGSSWPRNRTRVSCIAGGFFTNWAITEAQGKDDWTWKDQEVRLTKERPQGTSGAGLPCSKRLRGWSPLTEGASVLRGVRWGGLSKGGRLAHRKRNS